MISLGLSTAHGRKLTIPVQCSYAQVIAHSGSEDDTLGAGGKKSGRDSNAVRQALC